MLERYKSTDVASTSERIMVLHVENTLAFNGSNS